MSDFSHDVSASTSSSAGGATSTSTTAVARSGGVAAPVVACISFDSALITSFSSQGSLSLLPLSLGDEPNSYDLLTSRLSQCKCKCLIFYFATPPINTSPSGGGSGGGRGGVAQAEEAILLKLRGQFPSLFMVVYGPSLSEMPFAQQRFANIGFNMISYRVCDVIESINRNVFFSNLELTSRNIDKYSCPICSMPGLTEDMLCLHVPAYHILESNHTQMRIICPICRSNNYNRPFQVHLHHKHGKRMPSEGGGLPLYSFALVVCRHRGIGKYLLCHEFGRMGFWLPGGRVDMGEPLSKAAIRETLEEAGVKVALKGILSIEFGSRIEYNPAESCARMRVIFYAEPEDEMLSSSDIKSIPDYESFGACWASYEDLMSATTKSASTGGTSKKTDKTFYLRGDEPQVWAKYLEEGGQIFDLKLLNETDR